MKKGFIIGLATGLTVAGLSAVLANSQIQAILNDQIKVTLNGQVQEFKDETTNETQYPITYHDRTYLPLRNVAQLSGLSVDYDNETNTAILKKKNDTFVLYDEMEKLDFRDTLTDEYFKIEISQDGKTIKYGEKIGTTNLTKNIKSFKVVRHGMAIYDFIVLTQEGELYICDAGIMKNNYDFELLGSGYDAISNDIMYNRADGMSDPFVARTIEKDDMNGVEIDFVDYTIFMSREDKIQLNGNRP